MKLDERHVDIIRAALKEIQVDPEVQDAWQHALAEKNRHNPPARLGLTAEQERQLIANIGKHYANAGEEVSVKEIAEALQSAGILAHGRDPIAGGPPGAYVNIAALNQLPRTQELI